MAAFDEIAGSYDQWYLTPMGNFVDVVETGLAFEMFGGRQGMSVLDAGCGTGNFSLKLARRGCRVTGIDISPAMLEIAGEKASGAGIKIDFRLMDLYSLDFPDGHFDAVFSMAAFEFVKDPGRVLDELFRVTRSGGSILVGTINRDSSWGRLYSGEEYRKNSIFRHADLKSPEDFKQLRKESLVDMRECLFVPPGAAGEDISMEAERRLSMSERGGYFCALWRKR